MRFRCAARSRHHRSHPPLRFGLAFSLVVMLTGVTMSNVSATPGFADNAFNSVWTKTDAPVLSGAVSRSWFWGPAPNTPAMEERYLDATGQQRLVQYFDKGRMELNDPNGDPTSPWYVTSGLLDRELISGRIQIGSNTFLDTGSGAKVPIAGDPDNTFPTYNDFQRIVDQGQPDRTGSAATTTFLPSGTSTRTEASSDAGATYVHYVTYTGPSGSTVGYNIPRAFWDFMTQPGMIEQNGSTTTSDPLFNWVFVLGYPISDPVWAQVKVQGALQWVLIQPFERRVLTYTPSNPVAWRVEMGNIGQHYYRWRYASTPPVKVTGDQTFMPIVPGNQWVYSTSDGVDETWKVTGVSNSFSGGSDLLKMQFDMSSGRQVSYFGLSRDGIDLYGTDDLNASGDVTNTTIYWPPVHLFPNQNPYIGESWSTSTTVISSTGPTKSVTVSMQVEAFQSVSTPAGVGHAWKLSIVSWTGTDTTHPDKVDTTIWFAPNVGVMQWFTNGFAAQLKLATISPQ